jgi:hypothetical protein
VPQKPAPTRLTYSELVARQGLTKKGKVSRFGLDPVHRAILDRGPRRRPATVEEQIARSEKYVITLLRLPAGHPRGLDSEVIRAAKARGHILKVVELKAASAVAEAWAETPYEVMDRLDLTDAERERIGEFHVTKTWA